MASYLASSHWLVGVPNELGSVKATVDRFTSAILTVGGKHLAGACHALAARTVSDGLRVRACWLH